LLAILGIAGISLAGVAFGYSSEIVLGIFIFTSTFLLAAILEPLTAVLTANERLDYVTGVRIVGRLVFIGLGSIFLLSGRGFISLIVASLLQMPLQIGLALWAIRRHHLASLSFQIDPRMWPALIKSGLPFGLSTLMLTIAFGIDTVMLSKYEPENVVGWYNVAYNLVFTFTFLFRGFKEAIVPTLSRAYVQEPSQVERWYYRSLKTIAIISMPIAFGGTLVAFPLIRFLYTDQFLPSALALQILIWDVPLLMFNAFCGNMTTIVSEEKAAARIYGLNAAANILLNLYAIPRFGLVGAALVTVVTDLVGAIQFYLLLGRKLNLPNTGGILLRVLLASALMGITVWLAGDLNLFVLVALGVIVYLGLVLAFRILDDTEWRMIRQVIRKTGIFVQSR
jgi:O-antigen/teichoic acid export membrane protein